MPCVADIWDAAASLATAAAGRIVTGSLPPGQAPLLITLAWSGAPPVIPVTTVPGQSSAACQRQRTRRPSMLSCVLAVISLWAAHLDVPAGSHGTALMVSAMSTTARRQQAHCGHGGQL